MTRRDSKPPPPTAPERPSVAYDESQPTRCGLIALAGAPNVGKSTLLNRILGRRLSIATPKPQTTRTRVVGVDTRGNVQMVFLDTPGIHKTRGLIHKRMIRHARSSVSEADVVCWIVDASRGLGGVDRDELSRLDPERSIVVLNKIDLIETPDVLPLIAEIAEIRPDSLYLPVSARKGDGVQELLDVLTERLPEGPWLFDADALTDQNERFFVAELVREQLFLKLDQEMPYRVAVSVEQFEDEKKRIYVAANIYTNSESSKGMIIGKRGALIKTVGTAARRRIEELLDRPVFLDLNVKVREGWQDNERFLDELGI